MPILQNNQKAVLILCEDTDRDGNTDSKVDSDIEKKVNMLLELISRQLSGWHGSAYYETLLILLVGIGLIQHAFWQFLLVTQTKIDPCVCFM